MIQPPLNAIMHSRHPAVKGSAGDHHIKKKDFEFWIIRRPKWAGMGDGGGVERAGQNT